MHLPDEAHQFQYLCRMLSFESDAPATVIDLSAQDGHELWREALSLALVPGLLPAVCHRRLPQYGLADEALSKLPESYTERQARGFMAEHRYRCDKQRARLVEAVRALNACGIVPMLMAGSRAIWCGAPAWQFVQRLGLLVPRGAMNRAAQALKEAGLRHVPRIDPSGFGRDWHFFRPHLNGVVSLRDIGSNTRLKPVLGCEMETFVGHKVSIDDAEVLLPPAHIGLVCDLLHRHYCRPGFGSCVITLKELYEFSWSLARLNPEDHGALEALVLQSADVRTVLAAWGEEAQRAFGLGLPWSRDVHARLSAAQRPVIKTVLVAPEPLLGTIPFVTPLVYRLGGATAGMIDKVRRATGGPFDAINAGRRQGDRGGHRRNGV